jgi:peroxiredoxin
MATDLAALPLEACDDRAMPLVVSTGGLAENRQLVKQYGIHCVVLRQEQMEVASQFRVVGTPMGYRIDPVGRIASELTVGAEPLLQLAGANAPRPSAPVASGNGAAQNGRQPDPSLARSRLTRSGLKAGTVAPEFQLPRIDGGELTLLELRGRRVLLVFSDPECGPLRGTGAAAEPHQRRPDPQVVMVSRRGVDANRAKAAKIGLSFPIVLQKHWEISLKYGMFATPIGYLIDERGIIARDVAVGIGPILAVADKRTRAIDWARRIVGHPRSTWDRLGLVR